MGLSYVIAVVRADALEAVEQKLIGIGVRGLTVVKVKGLGRHANFFSRDWLSEEAKLEIVAHEDRVDAITRAIMEAAHTGDPGDGIVTVLPVSSFHRIRTRSEALPEDA
ncbi:MAG: P-II family nitrogen regulator [Betaproteobacteria bacterium]|nr:MAG: P-II family nitrogen regulator [Betaproteobacteria bacterium]